MDGDVINTSNTKKDPHDSEPVEDIEIKIYWKLRVCLAILTVVVCSLNVRQTTMQTMRHSRNMHRVLNR